MKNKKILRAIAALTLGAAAVSCLTLFGCSHKHKFSEEWKSDETSHWHEATCDHKDEVDAKAPHVYDNDSDVDCNVCGYVRNLTPATQFTVTFVMNDHGAQIEAVKVGENGKLAKPADPTAEGWTFKGWFTDVECTQAYDFETAVTGNFSLYALWEHKHDFDTAKWMFDGINHFHNCKVDGCNERTDVAKHTFGDDGKCVVCGAEVKEVSYEFIPSDLEAKTYAEGITSGIFAVLPDTTVRTRARENYSVYDYKNGYYGDSTAEPVATGFTASKSVQYNGSKRGISVNAISPGKLTIYVDNGSSGKTKDDKQSILLTRPDGSTETIEYCCIGLYAVTIDCDTVGTYTITRGSASGVGTTDLYYARFDTVVPVTAVEKIQVAEKGKTDYIVGQDFDYSMLQVQIVRELTGMIEPLDLTSPSVTVDSSAFDKTSGGTYSIVITYTDENGKKFETRYDVVVHAVEALQLGFNAIIHGGSTTAGNGTYVNHTVKQFYFKGQELDLDGLTVRTVFNGGKQTFIVTEGFTVTGYDKNTAGMQTIKVTWTDNPEIFKEFKVYVADYAASSIETTAESVTIKVNGGLADADIGTLADGVYRFKTIQQALDFLNVLEFGENTKKVINLADGLYKEKLEINIPNLTIKGVSTDATKTVIEWDSLYGIEDEGGFTHTTDSTATLNVREKAVGFVIENVTISNWYNSTAHFDEVFGAGYNEHRALAALIQADKVVIDNCRLLGYQDTIEFFTGRQVVQNTYICGRTDFIFGTNNTTYFKNCEIESIVSGGYVTAFKGCNKGDSDYIQYGAIFDGCRFTAPESVISAADTSLGRTWGKYAAVAYVNNNFAGHISKKAYGDGKGTRYTAMSGVEPTTSTVKFVEYNNTGDGAITEEVAGMKFLTAETVRNYTDMSVIFGTTNGGVTYSTAWDGSKGVTITEKTYLFSDYYTADDNMTYHEIPTEGEDIFDGLATITGTKWGHELNQDKDQAKFDAGCEIKFNIAGTVSVKTYGGSYGLPENVSINYKNGFAVIKIKATAASPITNGCYITSITLNKAVEGVHTHEYGEWVVTPAESGDNYGTAVRTCDDCELETAYSQSVTLPALSAEDYTISASATSGMATYTYESEFGEISFEAPELEGQHVHSYGAWTITATLEAAGTATKVCTSESCNNDDSKTVVVNIPALTDENYVVTDNTATLEAGGTGTYTITVGGVEVSFKAETPKLTLTRITEDFTYKYGGSGDPISTDKILFTNCGNSGGWVLYGKTATITLNLPEGATLKFTRSPFDNAEKVEINGVKQEGGKEAEIVYQVPVAGYVVISADDNAYLKEITVEIDPNYQHRHTFGDWKITVAEDGENYGTAVRSCVVENCGVANETQTVTLPALSAEKYDIAPGETEGKSIFTLKEEPSISFEADSLAGVHVHGYSAWTVTEENMPTAETTGKATRTCSGGDGCDGVLELALPVLTDSRYEITNNTATLTAAGTGTYTIELDGETVSFTAATPVLTLNVIDKNVTISFGSSGNYKTAMSENNLVAEFTSGGNIRDNGGNNSQLSGTTLNIKVKAGAKVAVSSYNGYTNYDVKIDGVKLGETQTGTSWDYTVENDCMVSFTSTKNDNYFYNISVSYGVKEITTNMTHSIAQDGIDGNEYFELNGIQDNNNQGQYWLFKNEATIKFKVAAGATITLNCGYWGNNNYIVVNGEEKSGLVNNTPLVIEMAEGGEVVISILNDETHKEAVYLQSIEVSFTA